MTIGTVRAGIFGVLSLLNALGCSGKSIHEVGDLNGEGGGQVGHAGDSAGSPDQTSTAGSVVAGGSDSGNTAGSSASAGAPGAPGAGATAVPDVLTGTWTGYIEQFKNSDLTDDIAITISADPVTGQVVFGDAKAPPAATNPEAAYPPADAADMGGQGNNGGPYAGFVFTMLSPSFAGARLQFDVAQTELFQTDCVLQTPYKDTFNNAGGYACLPNWTTAVGETGCWQVDPMTMEKVPRGCTQIQLCGLGGTCSCTPMACVANMSASQHFDLTIAGTKADGSISGLDVGLHNVHLNKQ